MTERVSVSQPEFDAELDNWTIVIEFAAFSPTRWRVRLAGQITGDSAERFSDGRRVLTSPVRTPKWRIASGAIIRTHNTRYRLLKKSDRHGIVIY